MLNLIKEMLAAGFSQPSNPYGFGEERHSHMGGLVSISSMSGALAEVSPLAQTWVFDGKPLEPGEQTSSSEAAGFAWQCWGCSQPLAGGGCPGQSAACSPGLLQGLASCSLRLLWCLEPAWRLLFKY